jgi:hypothetical protein
MARFAVVVMTIAMVAIAGCKRGAKREAAQRPAEPIHAAAPHDAGPPAEPVGDQVPSSPALPPAPVPAPAVEIQEGDALPAWWIDGPRWQGSRVRIAVQEDGASVRGARVAAVDKGLLELRRILGRDAREALPEQTQIARVGNRYRAYVLIAGE